MSKTIEMSMNEIAKRKPTKLDFKALEENRTRAKKLSDAFNPAVVTSKEPVLVAGDWHVPYQDRELVLQLYKVAEEFGIKTLLVPGDFWDCDNLKNEEKFVSMTYLETFQTEKIEVAKQLEEMLTKFKRVCFCRGNHEKRWLKVNKGMVGIDELFAITKVKGNFQVSLDNHIALYQGDSKWLLCHPHNYSPAQLNVAFSLADKHHCNIFSAHGHQMAQGHDRTGEFQIVDGGGMFDADQIEYLRTSTTFPSVYSGFYMIADGKAYKFEGHESKRII